jgi:hypothetical protein
MNLEREILLKELEGMIQEFDGNNSDHVTFRTFRLTSWLEQFDSPISGEIISALRAASEMRQAINVGYHEPVFFVKEVVLDKLSAAALDFDDVLNGLTR